MEKRVEKRVEKEKEGKEGKKVMESRWRRCHGVKDEKEK